jgi:gamma-glutamyltranspeptidase/glutathione hydrolase
VPEPLVPLTTRYSPSAMVSTIDHLATQAGLGVLRDGGSAADAAIAANAVLTVTMPNLCGMGGDLFALVSRDDAPPATLNAAGRAGAGADAARLRAEGRDEMPFKLDIRSVTVPGCVDGWMALHERFGRVPLDRVLAPAIGYARDGFPASAMLAASVPVLPDVPGAGDLRGPTGTRKTGEMIRRPGVARALEAIVSNGRAGFYEGEFGEGLLALGQGEYAAADFEASGAAWVDPIRVEAFDHIVWGVPPSSQGYVLLSSAWIADGLALPDDPGDPLWAHLLVEASKQAGRDRPEVLHDGADGDALLSTARLGPRRRAIDPDHASSVVVPSRSGDTTALCVVDGDGVGVSLIQSNASGFGSHLFEPATGINLHNRGLGFSIEEGHPAEYAPGRRPPHTLTPGLVTTLEGRLAAVLGTMGGDSQPQVLLQLLARTFRNGESPARAISAGRFRLVAKEQTTGFAIWTDPAGTAVAVEGNAPTAWSAGLAARGHEVTTTEPFDHGFGHAHLIVVGDGHLAGASDPRARSGLCSGS